LLKSKKAKSVVGIDIEAGSIAATEVSSNGSIELTRYGVVALEPGVFREGEVADSEALGDALKELFSKYKLSRTVRLGVANQRVAVRVLRLPAIDKRDELENAIRFQAQDHIPMPLEQAVLDWEVIGHVTGENGQRFLEAVVVAARRDMLGAMMDALGQAGLRPVGIDLSAFGMIRALAGGANSPVGAAQFVDAPVVPSYEERAATGVHADGASAPADAAGPASMYANLGDSTNLAVAQRGACLFTRISPFGVEGIAQKLAERRRLTLEHARQWLVHVGLEASPEEIEGDRETVATTREVLEDGASKLADELRLSLEFYAAQEGAIPVEDVITCGPGTMIPGLVERLQMALGHRFEIGRPAALGGLDDTAAARLTLSYGLALEQ
jgi:type IV pilus assembly protein PilM